MITIYICAVCECAALTTYGSGMCIKCHYASRNTSGAVGTAMGDRMIRVVLPTGKYMEMSVTDGVPTVLVDGERMTPTPSILAGARRKIRA